MERDSTDARYAMCHTVPDIAMCLGVARCHRQPPCPFCRIFAGTQSRDEVEHFVKLLVGGH